ncbi:hypothetical protein [Kitasatospora aureofaciens]|uniref:hypothetical protein n=1 Tax=Kitasatospora aureofaciens TaxID=1894 RepID=UPI001C446C67|nr:hypothetical protein [Kitasatospora aureofaciens]MBV6703199.1 hypothetical protein [Kitasatospora aureofaciens]
MYESPSRHRGQHRDPDGAVLGAVWAVGNAVAIALLGVIVHNDFAPARLGTRPAADSVPDSTYV